MSLADSNYRDFRLNRTRGEDPRREGGECARQAGRGHHRKLGSNDTEKDHSLEYPLTITDTYKIYTSHGWPFRFPGWQLPTRSCWLKCYLDMCCDKLSIQRALQNQEFYTLLCDS